MAFTEQHSEVRYQRTSDFVDVFIVEDHGLFRQGLREMLLSVDPALRISGAVASAEEAIRLIPEVMPDVVLMDVHLAEMTGIEATRRLAVLAPRVQVLVISGSGSDGDVVEAILAGACGYILKSSSIEGIAGAIRSAAKGGSVLSPEIASHLLDHVRKNTPSVAVAAEPVGQLTVREREVLRLMAMGMENADIGRSLVISTRTVRNHVASILEKLQMQNRIQAAVYAVRHGLG